MAGRLRDLTESRSVFDGGGFEGGLAVLHVDLKAHRLAVVLRDQLLLVLAQLGGELVVGHPVVRLSAALPRGEEVAERLLEVRLFVRAAAYRSDRLNPGSGDGRALVRLGLLG